MVGEFGRRRQDFRVWFKQLHVFEQGVVLDDLEREHAYYVATWWEELMTDVAELLDKSPVLRAQLPDMSALAAQLVRGLRRLRGHCAVENDSRYFYQLGTKLLFACELERRIRMEELSRKRRRRVRKTREP